MDESVLIDVKKLLGIDKSDNSFDPDLIIYINSFIPVLGQLGVDVDREFELYDEYDTWDDFISTQNGLQTIKTWMALKVRKVFDPPQSSTTMEALNSMINELEWRINVEVDPKNE